MGITREDVLRIAALARLELGEHEIERLTVQLDRILEHVGALPELTDAASRETERAEEPASLALRPDEPGADTLARSPAELAPAWEDGFFLVPLLPSMEPEGEAG